MNGHQEACDQRQAHAVQHVKPKQRAFTDKPSAKQPEPRIAGISYQADIAQ